MKVHVFSGPTLLPGAGCLYSEADKTCGRVADDTIHEREISTCKAGRRGRIKPLFIPRSEPEQFWPGSAMSVWQGHSDAVLALIKRKSEGYGNAWVEQGYMGNLARIFSKVSRLRNLLWSDRTPDLNVPQDPEDGQGKDVESVLDTLYDLSALCSFAIANIEEGNRWGR